MFWSKKRKPTVSAHDTALEKQSLIEIEAHKNATKEAITEAKQATHQLNKLLVDNGFTLKIYLATGGHDPRKQN